MQVKSAVVNPAVRGRLTLLAEGEVGSPALSGDGDTVVWNEMVDGQLDIMRYRDDTGQTDNLTHDRHPDMHADVNQDGSVIVWTRLSTESSRDPDASWDVYQWRDGQVSAVVEERAHEMDPSVSGDGNTIAYNNDGESGHRSWNVHRWHQGEDQALTSGRGWNAWPVVSDDGERVIWRQLRRGGSDVWLRDQQGTVKPAVIGDPTTIQPTLSGDGNRIFWTSSKDKERDLHMLDLGSGEHRVVAGVAQVNEADADVSADGNAQVWTNYDFRKGRPADTQVYLQRDGEVTRLTSDGKGMSYAPKVSDDGRVVVWTWHSHEDIRDRRIYRFELEES